MSLPDKLPEYLTEAMIEELRYRVGDDEVHLNAPLSRYMTARLGGNADVLVIVDDNLVLEAVARWSWAKQVPVRIFGAGANVLITDRGYRGLAIINHTREVSYHEDGRVEADSGASMTHIARESIARGLSGFGWAISVPGTIGGGAVNNAGAHNGAMADNLASARIVVPHDTEWWDRTQFAYQYRESALKHRTDPFCVEQVVLQLEPGHDPAALKAEADLFITHRKRTQPPGASLGSMFKNPLGDYAGRLIEACGLKGTRIGGVEISVVHANFFVNHGHGTASDYLSLIDLARESVRAKFGVELQLEVEIIGE